MFTHTLTHNKDARKMNTNLFLVYTNRVECGRRVTHTHADTFYETHDHQPEAGHLRTSQQSSYPFSLPFF